MKFNNRVVLVTGSSRGIGKHIALEFAKGGARVIVNYVKNKEYADSVCKEIMDVGGESLLIRADVRSDKQVQKMIDRSIKQFNTIDILVNNAGIHKDSIVWKMEKCAWNDVIDTNLTGTYNCTKAVLEPMKKQRYGRIINISSVLEQSGMCGASNYSASKAGIVGFTKSVAKEVAKYTITINSVSLGYFDIGMGREFTTEMKNNIVKLIPMKRFGKVKEISPLVLFLASEDSSYITGQTFNINGGYYL